MEYKPSTEQLVDRFIIGTVAQESTTSASLQSPSIVAHDRKIRVDAVKDPLSGSKTTPVNITYDSRSMPGFEVGRRYLFAFSKNTCVGFLDMPDDAHVYLPQSGTVALDTFIQDRLNKPFPDIFGAGEIIVPGDNSDKK